MQINSNFDERVVIQHQDLPWVPSPVEGIERRMLDRSGGEIARATSIVRYGQGRHFPRHDHEFGEEILVLEGAFQDEHGDYPAGTYIRNPPGSSHAPFTHSGCLLFVKLRHLDPADRQRQVVAIETATWHQGLVEGLSVLPLAEFQATNTAMVRWAPGTYFNPHRHYGGEEIFVVDGVFEDEYGRYPAGSWLRSPHMSSHKPFSVEGCTIFVKTGHLLTT
jgi:anti-sigma factor ChrR (cupin superfamily)